MKLVTQHNQVSHFFCPLFTLKITSLLIKIYLILTNNSFSIRILILRQRCCKHPIDISDFFLFMTLFVTDQRVMILHWHSLFFSIPFFYQVISPMHSSFFYIYLSLDVLLMSINYIFLIISIIYLFSVSFSKCLPKGCLYRSFFSPNIMHVLLDAQYLY